MKPLVAPGRRAVSAPAVAGGGVYVSRESDVYALDAVTGQQRWRFSTGRVWDEESATAVADGSVYVGSGSSLYAVNAHSRDGLSSPATM
ncbi:PQQ-binding-like beta-propeller repeat protein [Streptomyces sp. H27-C3]|uniref:outer membrane protein assembly factor BamB family protein n=1 Tax=Streptomyces sp. H27-C3 TaxID=3046305 RepID=UPI0024B96949|nr:PQQ-binding-like beta-propeller repeat protein [Streptomyces sp. H27-C3]MDJ0465868.1 PQQ-binding-like beta-propeller repeat protein [Streptomyces sp. H27-C3]